LVNETKEVVMSKKYYVVWKGAQTGVFDAWSKVQAVTVGRSDAQFMGFPSQGEAEQAFQTTYTKALMQRSLSNGSSSSSSSQSRAYPKTPSSSSSAGYVSGSIKTIAANKVALSQAEINIYCDGACSPNPGKSGTGIAVYHGSEINELWYGAYDANGTNNTAELIGMLEAFKLAQNYISQNKKVQILSDSKYSIDSITKWATGWKNKGWKKANGEPIKNPELVKACYTLFQSIKKDSMITHVKGHADIEGNELADRMAVLARSSHEKGFVKYNQPINIPHILATESG
jgi:ribonuclease HI